MCYILFAALAVECYASAGHVRWEISPQHISIEGGVTVGTKPTTQPAQGRSPDEDGEQCTIVISALQLAVEVGSDGSFVDGFDDDTISFSGCVPGTLDIRLAEPCTDQGALTLEVQADCTQVEFAGAFLVGMDVLRAAGIEYLDVSISTEEWEATCGGELLDYLGPKFRVTLGEYLEVAGIRVIVLPLCTE